MTLGILLLIGVGVALALVAAAQTIWFLGVKRGRHLERMEPPTHGVIHANDGRPWSVRAADANAAIDRLTRVRVVTKPGSMTWE